MSNGRRGPPNTNGMVSLKVDNLTFRTTPETLKRVFEKYGDVGDVYIPRDPFNQESRGFAFVRYYDQRDADDAIDGIDGTFLDGREIRVKMAKHPRPIHSYYRGGAGTSSRSRPRRRSCSRSRSRSHHGRRSSTRSRSRSRSRSNRQHSRSDEKPSRARDRRSPLNDNKSRSEKKKDRSHEEKSYSGEYEEDRSRKHKRNQSFSRSE